MEDEQTRQIYFIVDKSTLDVLRSDQDMAAIREGLADVEAGRVTSVSDSIDRIRQQLGLPRRTPENERFPSELRELHYRVRRRPTHQIIF